MRFLFIVFLAASAFSLRGGQNAVSPAAKPFMDEVNSIIEKYNLDKNISVHGKWGAGFSYGYQFHIPTDEESAKVSKESNELVLKIIFPAPEKMPPAERDKDRSFYSHVARLDAGKSIYWSMSYGRKIPADVLAAFQTRLE